MGLGYEKGTGYFSKKEPFRGAWRAGLSAFIRSMCNGNGSSLVEVTTNPLSFRAHCIGYRQSELTNRRSVVTLIHQTQDPSVSCEKSPDRLESLNHHSR
jgi:hypothetical protein